MPVLGVPHHYRVLGHEVHGQLVEIRVGFQNFDGASLLPIFDALREQGVFLSDMVEVAMLGLCDGVDRSQLVDIPGLWMVFPLVHHAVVSRVHNLGIKDLLRAASFFFQC